MQSKLLAIEFLALGVTGKLALWCSLDLLVPRKPGPRREQLAELIARASSTALRRHALESGTS